MKTDIFVAMSSFWLIIVIFIDESMKSFGKCLIIDRRKCNFYNYPNKEYQLVTVH